MPPGGLDLCQTPASCARVIYLGLREHREAFRVSRFAFCNGSFAIRVPNQPDTLLGGFRFALRDIQSVLLFLLFEKKEHQNG